MTRIWKAMCIVLAAAGVSSPKSSQAIDPICDFLPWTWDCRIAALQDKVNSHSSTLAGHAAEIADLEQRCNENTAAIAELEIQVAAIVAALGPCEDFDSDSGEFAECDTGECTNLSTDEDNCGTCGNNCAATEECVDGSCQTKTCSAPECQDPVLLADGTCTTVNNENGTSCSDGLNCTTDDTCNSGLCESGGSICVGNATCVEGPVPNCLP